MAAVPRTHRGDDHDGHCWVVIDEPRLEAVTHVPHALDAHQRVLTARAGHRHARRDGVRQHHGAWLDLFCTSRDRDVDRQLLAIAETTALSEWRDRAEEAGALSQRSLVRRGEAIEKLLSERSWRNSHSNDLIASIEGLDGQGHGTPDEWTKTHLMAEVFYNAAKVYLATVVNGPFPKGE